MRLFLGPLSPEKAALVAFYFDTQCSPPFWGRGSKSRQGRLVWNSEPLGGSSLSEGRSSEPRHGEMAYGTGLASIPLIKGGTVQLPIAAEVPRVVRHFGSKMPTPSLLVVLVVDLGHDRLEGGEHRRIPHLPRLLLRLASHRQASPAALTEAETHPGRRPARLGVGRHQAIDQWELDFGGVQFDQG